MEACPRGALALARGPPTVSATCDDCAVCSPACPTGAIAGSDEPLAASTVSCAFAEGDRGERVPCLAALSLPQVAARLRAVGSVELVCAPCEQCPRRRALGAVASLVRRARLLAEALGLPPSAVRLTPVAQRASGAAAVQRRTGLSRRGMFGLLRPRAGEGVDQSARGARQLLLEVLGAQTAPVPAEARVAFRFWAPAQCDGCAVCVRLCRPGALEVADDEAGRAIRFRPDRCTGCGLCVDVCRPQGARLEPVDAPVGALERPVPAAGVVRLRRQRCAGCGLEFFTPPANAAAMRCFVCSGSTCTEGRGARIE